MTLYIYRYLDTDGDGTGTKNAVGTYAAGAEIFYIQPPAHQHYFITRLIVSVGDETGMQAQDYGNIASGLTNGVTIRVSDSAGVLIDLTDGVPIKTNAGWGRLCYDVDVKTWGSGNELLVARWTFAKSGKHIHLSGPAGGKLEVVLNDDFDDLLTHYFMVQGYIQGG